MADDLPELSEDEYTGIYGRPAGGHREAAAADRADRRLAIAEAREARAAAAAEDSGGFSVPSTSVTQKSSTKTIVAMMAFATAFSVIGAEIRAASKTKATDKVGSALADPFVIILGGTTGAAVLTLIALAGDPGRKFGVGLAGLTLVTATLVNGGPVWDALRSALGSKATGGTGFTLNTNQKGNPTVPPPNIVVQPAQPTTNPYYFGGA